MNKEFIVTNWENELTDEPDKVVVNFVNKYYPEAKLNLLSGLKHRFFPQIYDTLHDSFAIIAQLNLLDEEQVVTLVREMAHGIWINFNSNVNNLTVRKFVFLSTTPFEDLIAVKEMCRDIKDFHGENALAKIVRCIDVRFYGPSGEEYEMTADGYYGSKVQAIRHK